MNLSYLIPAILISAVVTFSMRALPFVIFRGDKKMPKRLEQLGKVLPSAIMAVLVIYSVKDVIDVTTTGISQVIAAVVTAILYKWKHNMLIGIVGGTGVYMCLINLVF